MLQTKQADRRTIDFVDGTSIECTATRSWAQMDRWIGAISNDPLLKAYKSKKLPVPIGLCVKIAKDGATICQFGRNRYRKVVLVQLCFNARCILFMINLGNGDSMTDKARSFFTDPGLTFVSVHIKKFARWLKEDYVIELRSISDLRKLAAKELGDDELRGAGQRGLLQEVLGITWEKSKEVRGSDWETKPLSWEQGEYACGEAFASFKLGERLLPGPG